MSEITATDAARALGRLGGRATSAKYGRAHFSALGRRTPPRPRAVYQAMAKKGGAATRDLHGEAFYEAIGRKGGAKLLATRGTDYYRAIGRLGAAAKKAKREAVG